MCFLYHLLGGGTGDWDVPVGGMGAVSGALAAAAAGYGAEIIWGAEVYRHQTPTDWCATAATVGSTACIAGFVLANVTPAVLANAARASPRPQWHRARRSRST